MNFHSSREVAKRLESMDPLTREEMAEAKAHVQFLPTNGVNRYFAELLTLLADDLELLSETMKKNLDAIRRFDEASRGLNRRLIGLTVVLVVLTIALLALTCVQFAQHT